MPKLPLAVVINTKNSEATLQKALESVADIATQIIVMDMKSNDKTRSIAQKFTSEVYKSDTDYDYVEPARNAALAKVKEPWVFILDADEEISTGLKKVIKEIVENKANENDCYFVPRKNIIFDREMTGTGWWPDYQMRFFRQGKVEWSNQIHSIPEVHGKVEHLPADLEKAIIHHNFQKVNQFIDRLNRYTTIESLSGENQNLTPSEVFDLFVSEFNRRFFLQKGIDEGIHGLSLSLLQSTYQLSAALKRWEKAGFPQTQSDQKKTIKSIRNFEKDLNYWIAEWNIQNTSGLGKMVWQVRRKLKW